MTSSALIIKNIELFNKNRVVVNLVTAFLSNMAPL